MTGLDWRSPDYSAVRAERAAQLARIRERPEVLPGLREHYRHNPAAFISAWGMTSDPRLVARGLPSEIPLLLMPRQAELVDFIVERLGNREGGIVEKSRDCGASVIIAALAATLCLFIPGVVIGIGSRKEDALDRPGDPSSIFHKIRFFLKNLPPEFRGSWDESRHSAHMRIQFPESVGSAVIAEAGDNIGRGGRTTAYFIDEAAFLERPELIERSLASTTNTRIDVSTPNGRANSFAVKRWSGKLQVFTFRWQDDLRKDQAWYQRQVETLDPITLAQEVDLSYDASVEGILIPAAWVQAAIGAHTKLGIEPSGERHAALDVADEGRDKNALAGRHGVLLEYLSSWSGKDSNIYATTIRALNACSAHHYPVLDFDADGLGAGVRGDAVQINEKRREAGKREIEVSPFRGSGSVYDPDGSLVEGRQNRDHFANLKAQGWMALRLRFQATYRAVVEGHKIDPDSIISIDPALPELHQLVAEISQPTYSLTAAGKILVDKTPDGATSPNLADAVMMAFAASRPGAYFAAPVAAPSVEAAVLPADLDVAFGQLAFGDGAAAAIFWGTNLQQRGGNGPLYVLDWDVRELDGTFEAWLLGVPARLEELRQTSGCRFAGAQLLIDLAAEAGLAELIRQRGFPAVPIGETLPPVAERFAVARPYVNLGLVRLTRTAVERTVSFRSASRNFLRELIGRPEVIETHALAIAFASAVLCTYVGRRGIPVAPALPRQEVPHAAAPLAPRPQPQSGGLSPGFHIVNGIGVRIDDPRASIRLSLEDLIG